MNRYVRLLSQASLGILAAICLPSFAFVYTPTSGSVSDLGAAGYAIPIQIPPGTTGMVPKLSFSYSSLGTNGNAGVGWALSGLSAITRCSQTITTDSTVGGVRLDANDRFCLDGQRLVQVIGTGYPSGAYGADGIWYWTECEPAWNYDQVLGVIGAQI